MTGGPVAGRVAVVKFGGVTVGKLRNWSISAKQAVIKDYSMDSLDPEVITGGERSFGFKAEMLWVNSIWANSILGQATTGMSVVFYPSGTVVGEPIYTLANAIFSGIEIKGDKNGVTLQSVDGEGKSLTISH